MDNYKQKLYLLCILLLGCVLTSIATEYFSTPDEPIKIQVPKFVEQQPNNTSQNFKKQSKNMEQASAIININTATIAELDTLPGIGPAIANRIVEFRNQQPFTKIEDIMLVKGIGKKKFAKLQERITVE